MDSKSRLKASEGVGGGGGTSRENKNNDDELHMSPAPSGASRASGASGVSRGLKTRRGKIIQTRTNVFSPLQLLSNNKIIPDSGIP